MIDYATVNAAWPETLPPITRGEAQRAARKLMWKFGKRKSNWCRRIWISTRPLSRGTARGWWRLVHDVSHRVHYYRKSFQVNDHGGWHAELEHEMVTYVVTHGWLEGKLKPKERVKPMLTREDKIEHARQMLEKWERKGKLAATKIKLWRRRQAAAEKRAYLETVGRALR